MDVKTFTKFCKDRTSFNQTKTSQMALSTVLHVGGRRAYGLELVCPFPFLRLVKSGSVGNDRARQRALSQELW